MDKIIRGKAFVLGDNVDTDQIIPAQYLSYDPGDPAERKLFGVYALSGVPAGASGLPDGDVPFVAEGESASEFAVIVAGKDFGCCSSREHAPLALAEAGVKAVVAQSYARIFYRNTINGGYLVPMETPTRLIERIATGDELEIDVQAARIKRLRGGEVFDCADLGDAGQILAAGGIFEFAKQQGML